MKIYFLSSLPCALFLNGVYFGTVNLFERFTDVNPKDGIFAEFIPENATPIRFFITEDLRFTPPDGCEIYLLKDGIAVYAKDFPPRDLALSVLFQERKDDMLITVFRQGYLQLSVESQGELRLAKLPCTSEPTGIELYRSLIFIYEKNALSVFNRYAEPLLYEKVESSRLERDILTAVLPLCDRLGRVAECEWTITENGLVRSNFTIKQKSDDDTPPLGLIAYAFFESLLIGAPYTEFLDENLQEKAEFLPEFLGNFIDVDITNEPNEFGLVYKKCERIFELRYVRVVLNGDKICDILQ